MLLLASHVWKLPPQSALLKLQAAGCLEPGDTTKESLQEHLLHTSLKQQRLVELLLRSNRELQRADAAGALLEERSLDLRRHIKGSRVERMLGYLSRNLCREKLAGIPLPGLVGSQRSKGDLLPAKLNHGLVLPFYDRPGRPCGLLVLGPDKRPAEYVPLYGSRDIAELGLAGHPTALRPQPKLFAFDDALVVATAQLRHMHVYAKALPMLAWSYVDHARTDAAWDMLCGSQIHFWTEHPGQFQLWWQLLRTDGWLCWNTSPRRGLHILRQHQPQSALKLIEARSMPWPAALGVLAAEWSDADLEGLLLQLQAAGANLQQIFDRCPQPLVERCRKLLAIASQHVSTTLNGRTIEQHGDSWFVKTPQGLELICEAVLRIDSVVTYEDGQHELVGHVRHAGRRWEFVALQAELQTDAAGWLEKFLLDKQAGLARMHKSWKQHLFFLAMAMHKPEVKKGYSHIGWHAGSRELVLPTCAMSASGLAAAARVRGQLEQLPAANLRLGQPLLPHLISPLTADKPRNRLFWNIWARAVYNVVAPIFGQPTLGIALSSEQAYRIGKAVAMGLGCRLIDGSDAKEEGRHLWPVFLTAGAFVPSQTRQQIMQPGPRNCLTRTTTLQAKVLDLNGGWTTVYTSSGSNTELDLSLVPPAQMLTECFLTHLLDQLAKNPLTKIRSLADLTELLSSWLKKHWQLEIPEIGLSNPTSAFSWLLADLIAWGRLELLSLDNWSGKLTAAANGVLSWSKLQEVLQELNAPPLQLDVLEQVRPGDAALVSRDAEGDHRILIPESLLLGLRTRGRMQGGRPELKIYSIRS